MAHPAPSRSKIDKYPTTGTMSRPLCVTGVTVGSPCPGPAGRPVPARPVTG